MDRGLECGWDGERRMGVGGSEEINLLLMGAFLIDFSSICNCFYIFSGYTHLALLSQDIAHARMQGCRT
jgi:hypothetical protein